MAGHTNPRKGSMTLGLPPPPPVMVSDIHLSCPSPSVFYIPGHHLLERKQGMRRPLERLNIFIPEGQSTTRRDC